MTNCHDKKVISGHPPFLPACVQPAPKPVSCLLAPTARGNEYWLLAKPSTSFFLTFVAHSLSASSLDCRETLFIIVKSHLITALINP